MKINKETAKKIYLDICRNLNMDSDIPLQGKGKAEFRKQLNTFLYNLPEDISYFQIKSSVSYYARPIEYPVYQFKIEIDLNDYEEEVENE